MRYIIGLLALLALLGTGCTAPATTNQQTSAADQGTVIEPPVVLSDFTLPSSQGGELSLSQLHGKPTLMFFGYSFCPDVCPTTLSDMKRVKTALGADADQLQVVFVSVDGERDTPEVLKRYVENFDPSFVGLQGDDATLRRIGKEYGLFYERHKVEGTSAAYLVDHSSATYLIDAEGRLRLVYSYGTAPDVLAAGVTRLLNEQ